MNRLRRSPKARWTSGMAKLSALSVRQPWAWLIVNGYKDVENRKRRILYRGPLLIHAGLNKSESSELALSDVERRYGIRLPRKFDFGGIVGMVDVVDCRSRGASPWYARGNVAWLLAKPRRLPFRKCKGALSLFKPKFEKN